MWRNDEFLHQDKNLAARVLIWWDENKWWWWWWFPPTKHFHCPISLLTSPLEHDGAKLGHDDGTLSVAFDQILVKVQAIILNGRTFMFKGCTVVLKSRIFVLKDCTALLESRIFVFKGCIVVLKSRIYLCAQGLYRGAQESYLHAQGLNAVTFIHHGFPLSFCPLVPLALFCGSMFLFSLMFVAEYFIIFLLHLLSFIVYLVSLLVHQSFLIVQS